MIPADPRPFTLRELLWMADGAHRERWMRMGPLMALIANVNRDPRRCRPFRPEDFDPFAAKAGPEPVVLDRTTVGQLRRALGR